MAAKAILVLCAQALLIQTAFTQCVSPAAVDATRYGAAYGQAGRGWGNDGLAYDGLAASRGLAGRSWGYDGLADAAWPARGLGYGCSGSALDITATSGGGLPVTSGSAIPPVGISIASENVYEGLLAAVGELPFVGTVAVDGVVPTAGAGAVNYGCGNGDTVMVAIDGLVDPALGAFAPAIGAFGPAAIGAPTLGYGAGWAGPRCGCGF